MIIYGLKTCDTCRKALKLMPNAKFWDVRAQGVPENVLKSAYAALGDALLNTRSTTWRGLDDEARKQDPLTLIADHPTVMKRPLIEVEGKFHLGWGKETQAAILGE